MNVLITSSSAKVLLVKSFISAVSAFNGKVFTGDISANTAAAFFGEKHFVLPRTSDKRDFSDKLEHICKENDIKLVVPTRDGELGIMSEIKEQFRSIGTEILVPSEKTVETCLNKKIFSEFLNSEGFNSIPILSDLLIGPPYFIRPVYGAASLGAKIVNTHEEAKLFMNSDFLLHPFIDADEFSIDLLMSLDGKNALQAVCRNRCHTVGGESKIGTVVNIPVLEKTCLKIGESLGLVGHNVLQAFYSEDLGVIMIEANARFGGASNLSISSGLDSPNRIVRMLKGDKTAYANNEIKFGLSMYRYSEDVIHENTFDRSR